MWFATLACACLGHATAQNITGNSLTVTGNSTGDGWGLFKQGVDFGTGAEAKLKWFPGTFPAGTATFDIQWADGTFTWRDTYTTANNTTVANNKMSLDAANNLILFRSSGSPIAAGITFAPDSGKITLPAGTTAGIFFGGNAAITSSASGTPVFPGSTTFSGANTFSGISTITNATQSSSSTSGALTVAGGIGVTKDSWINGVRIGKGPGTQVTMNTVIGDSALMSNSTGIANSAIGYRALEKNTTGDYNMAVGPDVLRANTSGHRNVATGANALTSNTSGSYLSAYGISTLCSNTTGELNSAMGYQSLALNTAGSQNSAIGAHALYANTSGSSNVAVGSAAGRFQANGSTALTDPENSIYIGANSRGKDNNDNNSIVIGANSVSEGPNTAVIGNSATLTTRLFGTVTASTISASYISAYSMTPYSLAVSSSSMTVGGYPVLTSTNATNSIGFTGGTASSGGTAMSGGTASSGGTAMSGGTASSSGATAMSGGVASNFYNTAVSNGRASGVNSFAAGNFATAGSFSSTALGSYNSSFGGNYSWIETDPILMVGNGTAPNLTSNALVTLKNGNTTLTNKAWKAANPSATPNAPTALVDPGTTIDPDSGGNALVVDGHTVLNGKVIISVPQGDISMGIYQ
jgi:hypothetical protein